MTKNWLRSLAKLLQVDTLPEAAFAFYRGGGITRPEDWLALDREECVALSAGQIMNQRAPWTQKQKRRRRSRIWLTGW